MVKDAMESVCD